MNSCGGVGNLLANCLATDWTHRAVALLGPDRLAGRRPLPVDERLRLRRVRASCSVTAIGVWIRIVCLGMMYWTASPAFSAAIASLS